MSEVVKISRLASDAEACVRLFTVCRPHFLHWDGHTDTIRDSGASWAERVIVM